jgi:hypothetical protein
MKSITAPPSIGIWHPLKTVRGLPGTSRVDKESRRIYGVSLIQLGPLNPPDDRPFFADEVTLQQALSLGKASPKGVKSRLTHPNMSNDGMGRQLGRFRNWRLSDDGQHVLADQHLASFAFRGGDSSIGGLVLDMAHEDPESFGVSLAPVWDSEEMERLKTSDGRMPMRFKKLIAADIVDEPAATRGGLFGDSPLSIGTAPHKATQALDTLFADASPDVIRGRVVNFIDSYLSTRFGGQGNNEGDDMSTGNESKNVGLTQEALDATLVKFGETLSVGLLAKMDAKLAAINPAKEKDGDPAPLSADEIRSAERKRCSELTALAKNSGMEDWEKIATGWIDKNLSIVEAKAAIGDLAIAKNGLSNDSGQPSEDPDAKYKAEYQKQLSSFTHMGLSLKDYITSRRIDDGAELLAPNLSSEAA